MGRRITGKGIWMPDKSNDQPQSSPNERDAETTFLLRYRCALTPELIATRSNVMTFQKRLFLLDSGIIECPQVPPLLFDPLSVCPRPPSPLNGYTLNGYIGIGDNNNMLKIYSTGYIA